MPSCIATGNKIVVAIGRAWLYHCSSSNAVAARDQGNNRGNCHVGCHAWLQLEQQGIHQQRSGAACCGAPSQYNTVESMHPLAAKVLGWQASGKQSEGQADKELGQEHK